jgi:hypothetical protein
MTGRPEHDRTGQKGQDKLRKDKVDRTAMTVHPGHDSRNRTTRTESTGLVSLDRSAGQVSQITSPGQDRDYDSRDRKARKGHLGQDI